MKACYIETSVLKAPAYISNEPEGRATWCNLYLYCADQENGGVIKGAAAWKDRMWQQAAGVTLAEVQNAPGLVWFKNGDVHLALYEKQAAREAEGQAKIAAMTVARWSSGKVGSERAKQSVSTSRDAPTLKQVRAEFTIGGTQDMADAFFAKWEGLAWTERGSPLINWRARIGSFIANWRANDHAARQTGGRRHTTETTEAKAARSADVESRIFRAGKGKPA